MEENRDRLNITLHVYDTDMSVKIPREDEEYYRKAANLISSTVNTYAGYYKGQKSDKDILYMALIDIALQLEKQTARNDTEPYHNILSKLTSEIEEALK